MEGVKNLVPKEHNLPLTKMVDQLNTPPSSTGISSAVGINQMMGGSSQTVDIDETFCFFDPKLMHQPTKEYVLVDFCAKFWIHYCRTVTLARQQQAQDLILFVVGGGNYVEYQNFVDYGTFHYFVVLSFAFTGKRKNLMRVTYGCTELVNPTQFCDQVGFYSFISLTRRTFCPCCCDDSCFFRGELDSIFGSSPFLSSGFFVDFGVLFCLSITDAN